MATISPSTSLPIVPTTSTTLSTTTSTTSQPPTTGTSTTVLVTTSSSSSQSSSSSSSTSSSSSSSSALPVTTTTPIVRPTSTNALPTTQTTGPGIAVTSTKFVTSTGGGPQPTTTADASSTSSKGFFSNTGAVAGVFSLVGLVGLALLIALITNGIRRRKARKFDKELQAATLEAASAPKPVFLDDDDDVDPYRNRGVTGSQGYNSTRGYGSADHAYSDAASHGTYAQPPMSTESYGMREMGGGGGVNPGEIYNPYGVGGVGGAGAAGVGAAGAAGIGVARARSTTRGDGGYAAGLQDGAAPYAAFAAPVPVVPMQHDPYAGQIPQRGVGVGGGRDPNLDNILDAAGIGAPVAGAGVLARGQSQYKNAYNSQYQPYPSQPQPQPQYGGLHQRTLSQLHQAQELEYANLSRAKSKNIGEGLGGQQQQPLSAASNATSNATQYYSPIADSYQSHSYTPQTNQQPENRQSVITEDMDDAYGGYVADENEHDGPVGVAYGVGAGSVGVVSALSPSGQRQSGLMNPFEGKSSSSGHGFDDRESRYSDEEVEEEVPKRVLKVANE